MPISLVGHPYTPIGMGEHVRCTFRALRSVAVTPRLVDVYRLTDPDPGQRHEMSAFDSRDMSEVNIFHINGDEVEQVLAHLGAIRGYNIVYPLWELARYPEGWARQLERFDEIWAPSLFIRQSIADATARPVLHMPLTGEVLLTSFLGRRHFGIPEPAYAFLFFFDLRSYIARKNPEAVIEAFRRLVRLRPDADLALVIKVNGADQAPVEAKALSQSLADLEDRAILITNEMTDNEVKNLTRCCDCFVSLHRAEGFGFGMAQAMYLNKPVIATGYSGNMDFMTTGGCFVVAHTLVPVPPGAYPHAEGQVWAEPSIDDAVAFMRQLVDDPASGQAVGKDGGYHVRRAFGLRATGMRIVRRLDAIAAGALLQFPIGERPV